MRMRGILLGFALCLGISAFGQTTSAKEQQMLQKAKDIISKMSLQEKVSQMMNEAAGIERLGIKPYDWWSEALHGVARNGRATMFPEPIGLGATFDAELIHEIGEAISWEARAKFIASQRIQNYGRYAGLTFWSPNVNIFRDPRWGRGMETYGEDPFLSGTLGTAFVKGLQGDDPFYLRVGACGKHFAVHSGPEGERHSFDAVPSKRDLYETYLPAFKMLVQEGKVESIMGAYNRVYGESASGSKLLLTDILRKEWGFKGHVLSDCGAVGDILSGHHIAKTAAEAAAISVKSGLSLECGSTFHALPEAVKQGLLTEAEIDEALIPLMMTRLKLGIIGTDPDCPYNEVPESVVGCQKHIDIAYKAAVESMVLLKNDNVLPLKKDLKELYIVGPAATDAFYQMGNYYGVTDRSSTYLQGIVSKISNGTTTNYRQGFLQTTGNVNPLDWGLGEARGTEYAIVFVGNSGNTEGEEGDAISSPMKGDRVDIKLPKSQMDYLRQLGTNRTNKVITVVTGGSPVEMQEIVELSDVVIMAWYPGQEGGWALGDLLFGDANFSGRLPMTFPKSVAALPDYKDYSMQGRTYKYMKDNIMFPFGYGLTYGKVLYQNVSILNNVKKYKGKEPLELQVELKNDGDHAITEIAQVYVSAPDAGFSSPIESLVAFKRVILRPNESKTVRFSIAPEKLQMVQEDGSSKLLKGNYRITVAGAAPSHRTTELGVSSCSSEIRIK